MHCAHNAGVPLARNLRCVPPIVRNGHPSSIANCESHCFGEMQTHSNEAHKQTCPVVVVVVIIKHIMTREMFTMFAMHLRLRPRASLDRCATFCLPTAQRHRSMLAAPCNVAIQRNRLVEDDGETYFIDAKVRRAPIFMARIVAHCATEIFAARLHRCGRISNLHLFDENGECFLLVVVCGAATDGFH